MIERRERHPRQSVRLLRPIPNIELPVHVTNLRKKLQSKRAIVCENKLLLVSQDENRDSTKSKRGREVNVGVYRVSDKKSGLPNYWAFYEKRNTELKILGVCLFDYTVSDRLQDEINPLVMVSRTDIHGPSTKASAYKTITRTSLEFDPESLTYAHGTEEYTFTNTPYDKKSKEKLQAVSDQVAIITEGKYQVSVRT